MPPAIERFPNNQVAGTLVLPRCLSKHAIVVLGAVPRQFQRHHGQCVVVTIIMGWTLQGVCLVCCLLRLRRAPLCLPAARLYQTPPYRPPLSAAAPTVPTVRGVGHLVCIYSLWRNLEENCNTKHTASTCRCDCPCCTLVKRCWILFACTYQDGGHWSTRGKNTTTHLTPAPPLPTRRRHPPHCHHPAARPARHPAPPQRCLPSPSLAAQ